MVRLLRSATCNLDHPASRLSERLTDAPLGNKMPQVEIGDDTLTQTLTATNDGQDSFELTAALHTYYAISAIDKVHFCSLFI